MMMMVKISMKVALIATINFTGDDVRIMGQNFGKFGKE